MSTRESWANLAAKLTPDDRESYAALISYHNSLPPGDEFARVMELVGLLSLLGQRIPDAANELLGELRYQRKAATAVHFQITEQLASLPQKIANGIDTNGIVLTLSEVFRQQIEKTGLENTATLLRASTKDLHSLSCLISDSIKTTTQEYTSLAATISSELEKLTFTSRHLLNQRPHFSVDPRLNSWIWQLMLIAVIFLLGSLCGIVFDKNQTAVLSSMSSQTSRIQTPEDAKVVPPRKSAKR